MSWRRLRVLVTHLPRDSALWRQIFGDDAEWGLAEQLQAATVDGVNLMIWQNGSGKKADLPKRIPRPGVDANEGKTVTKLGGDTVRTPEEIDAFLKRATERGEPSPSSSPPPT